jgi:hypothetical protein
VKGERQKKKTTECTTLLDFQQKDEFCEGVLKNLSGYSDFLVQDGAVVQATLQSVLFQWRLGYKRCASTMISRLTLDGKNVLLK